jgi:hypothetical protein
MKTKGISKGYGDNTYRPFESVSREAMAAFVYRLAGEPAFAAPVKSPFNDVGTGSRVLQGNLLDESGQSFQWLV